MRKLCDFPSLQCPEFTKHGAINKKDPVGKVLMTAVSGKWSDEFPVS